MQPQTKAAMRLCASGFLKGFENKLLLTWDNGGSRVEDLNNATMIFKSDAAVFGGEFEGVSNEVVEHDTKRRSGYLAIKMRADLVFKADVLFFEQGHK